MKAVAKVLLALTICASLFTLSSCKKASKNQFASINSICEYATLKCYYHNVAEFEDAGKVFIVTYGNKKAWIEYSGIVKMGIDASQIDVSSPDKNGNITVSMPHAKVLSVSLDTNSINEDWIENGLFAKVSAEDRTKAIAEAQKNMEEAAQSDSGLIQQSENRAKAIIESYIQTVGKKTGKTYTITWNIIE